MTQDSRSSRTSQQFRKKPVVIEAIRWDNSMEVYTFLYRWTPKPVVSAFHPDRSLMIETLEGWLKADEGDWIIKGVKGELYACKPDIFAMTYEEASAPSEIAPTLPLNIDSTTRYFALPEPLINLLQSTLGYYASMDTYIGERTGGVLQGCPRGAPDIHRDMGKHAGTAYSTLVKMYPLREVPPTTKGA